MFQFFNLFPSLPVFCYSSHLVSNFSRHLSPFKRDISDINFGILINLLNGSRSPQFVWNGQCLSFKKLLIHLILRPLLVSCHSRKHSERDFRTAKIFKFFSRSDKTMKFFCVTARRWHILVRWPRLRKVRRAQIRNVFLIRISLDGRQTGRWHETVCWENNEYHLRSN